MPDQQPQPFPWERQSGESARAHAAFVVYRDLGPRRSLDAVCRQLYGGQTGRKRDATGRVQEWSSTHSWVDRVRAWDQETDKQGREAQLNKIRNMHARHAEQAVALQEKALERLKAMVAKELSPAQVLDYLVEAAKLERLARGEPETIQEQRTEGPADDDFFKRVERYADTLRQLRERGVLAGPVPDFGDGKPLATSTTNGAAK